MATKADTITLAEASRRLGVSVWTLRRLVKSNDFYPVCWVGKTPRVNVVQLNKYLVDGGQRVAS